MEAHDREGVLAGMMPEATARMLAVMPRAMAVDALQALIQPIAQQVLRICPQPGSNARPQQPEVLPVQRQQDMPLMLEWQCKRRLSRASSCLLKSWAMP